MLSLNVGFVVGRIVQGKVTVDGCGLFFVIRGRSEMEREFSLLLYSSKLEDANRNEVTISSNVMSSLQVARGQVSCKACIVRSQDRELHVIAVA